MRTELIDKLYEAIPKDTPSELIFGCKANEPADDHINVDGIDVYFNHQYGYVDVIGLEEDELNELVNRFGSMYPAPDEDYPNGISPDDYEEGFPEDFYKDYVGNIPEDFPEEEPPIDKDDCLQDERSRDAMEEAIAWCVENCVSTNYIRKTPNGYVVRIEFN